MTSQPAVLSRAWIAFAVVALVGLLDSAFAWAHGIAPRHDLETSTRIVAGVYVVAATFMAARAYANRGVVSVFLDHAVITCLILAGAWDVVSPFAFGRNAPEDVLLHVFGGGATVVLMVGLVLSERPRERDPYFEQIRATWRP